jgi:hypothetical protein
MQRGGLFKTQLLPCSHQGGICVFSVPARVPQASALATHSGHAMTNTMSPDERFDELVESGDGARFDANKGTPMKEWLSLDAGSTIDWQELAREGLAFVTPA